MNALDYVLKPISEFAFYQELDKAVRKLKGRNEEYLTVAQEKGIVRLNLSQNQLSGKPGASDHRAYG